MRIEFRMRAKRDANAIGDKHISSDIEEFIEDALRTDISALQKRYDFKPLRTHPRFYRLRVDDYRLGCRYDQYSDTLIIMRLLHRENIYKVFP